MKLAILSCSPECYSTRRLREAAAQRGHQVKVLNTLKFSIDLEEGHPDLYYHSKPLSQYDAVLPRIGASITYFGTAVVRQFEQMDVFCANTSAGISNSRDKLRSLQILSRHQVGIPGTTFVRDRKDVLPAIERVGGAPVVIKLLEGTQGVGVILADSVNVAEAIIETLHSTKQNVLVQKFVAESKGRDLIRTRTAQTWAVVIGVGKYEEVPKLALTVNDAENVAQALITSGNVPIQNILRLTDAEAFEHQPTSQTLHQKIPQWLAQAAPQDTVIIFFAGHGVVGADGMYLAPQDVSMNDQAPGGLAIRNGMALTWLREQLGQCRAKVKLLWLDACHSGSLRSASLDGEKMARTFDNLEGVVTIASCKGSQVSLESPQLGGGLFSHYLVSGLEGEADANQDAKIDVDELYGFVHRSVSTRAKDFNAVQTPVRSIFSGEGVPVVLSLPQKFPTTPVENNQRPPQTTVVNSPPVSTGNAKSYREDFLNIREGALPEGWKADETVSVRKTGDRPRLEAPEPGQRVVTVPHVQLVGDFYLECEFTVHYYQNLELVLLGARGMANLPLKVSADSNLGYVTFPGGVDRRTSQANNKGSLRLRIEREGVIYRVYLNRALVHARRLRDYQDFNGLEIRLTGGLSSGNVMRFYWLEIGSRDSDTSKTQRPAYADWSPRERFEKGLHEDFRQTANGAIPFSWEADASVAVRDDGGRSRLEADQPDWQKITSPEIAISGDFVMDLECELQWYHKLEVTLSGTAGDPDLPFEISCDRNQTFVSLQKGTPLSTNKGGIAQPLKVRLQRQQNVLQISVEGEIVIARTLKDASNFRGVRLAVTGGPHNYDSFSKINSFRLQSLTNVAKP